MLVGVYLALSLGIGLLFRKTAGKSLTNFFLGGRRLNWFVAGISLVATTFAADTPLAVTEIVMKNGVSGNWIWWGLLFGGMLTVFYFANLWRRSAVLTDAELIELRYSGREAGLLRAFKAGWIGLVLNSIVIAWVNLAMITILNVFFNISNTEALWWVGGLMLLTSGYSAVSGLLGVAITDVIQFVIAMAGCIVLSARVVGSPQIGGIAGLKAKLPAWSIEFFPSINTHDAVAKETVGKAVALGIGVFLARVAVQWWASWYPGAEPGGGGYVAQRILSAKNERHSVYGTLFFQVAHYALRPWPWILVGLCAIILYPHLPETEYRFAYAYAMRDFLPAGLRGLLLVSFLAAYMSTISTQLNLGASYMVNDIFKRYIAPQASEKRLVGASRVGTLLLMLISLAVTTQVTSISGAWDFLLQTGAGTGMVLLLRWYWWRVNAWSEIVATVAPALLYTIGNVVLQIPYPTSYFLTVGGTTVAWLATTYLTKPGDLSKLSAFYALVQPGGWWGPIAKTAAVQAPKNGLPKFVCWISSVVFTYCLLFAMGKFIFQEYMLALLYVAGGVLSLLVLNYTLPKAQLFGQSDAQAQTKDV